MAKDSLASSLSFYQIRQRGEVFRAQALSMSYKCSKVGRLGYQGLKVLAAPQEALELPTARAHIEGKASTRYEHQLATEKKKKKKNETKQKEEEILMTATTAALYGLYVRCSEKHSMWACLLSPTAAGY